MQYYNKIAKSYNKLHSREQLEKAGIILENIKSRLRQEKHKMHYQLSLLDIGAGTCISTKPFARYCRCTAIDPSKELLSQCKSKKIRKIIAKAENLPFKNKTFDVIISITALHHANLKKAIKEINRVAKPNAIIAISFLKKSKKLNQVKKLLRNYRQIKSEKDIIFIKT